MLNFNFENELLDAIEKALSGSGIKPHYVLNKIVPVIEKHAAQQSVQATGWWRCEKSDCRCRNSVSRETCVACGSPRA